MGLEADTQKTRRFFELSVKLCKSQSKVAPDPTAFWFKVLDMVLQSQKTFILPNKSHEQLRPFLAFYDSLVKELFEEITKFISLEDLMAKLQETYSGMTIGDLKKTILHLLLNFESDKLFNSVIQTTVYRENHAFVSSLIRSKSNSSCISSPFCSICKTSCSSQPFVSFLLFKCGHITCLNCQMEIKQRNIETICVLCELCEAAKVESVLRFGRMFQKRQETGSKMRQFVEETIGNRKPEDRKTEKKLPNKRNLVRKLNMHEGETDRANRKSWEILFGFY